MVALGCGLSVAVRGTEWRWLVGCRRLWLAGRWPTTLLLGWCHKSSWQFISAFLPSSFLPFPIIFFINPLSFHPWFLLSSGPWVICGFLNLIFVHVDKMRGSWASFQRKIHNLWNRANLIDLGFVNNRFTWSNLQLGVARIIVRLDRACANPAWTSIFLRTNVCHLNFGLSEHCPILLDTYPITNRKGSKPFRFLN